MEHLQTLKLEPGYERVVNTESAQEFFARGIEHGFAALGLDNTDPSLKDTPRRFGKMLVQELCAGLNYKHFPKCTTTPNDMHYNQMVLVRDIQLTSLCEHHLQTIDGLAHIAYIPSTKVLGLSKFARVVEFFARRPQIQERLTEQIYAALAFILETEDVAVVVNATHFCMKARGVSQQQATTQTDKVGGRFMSNPTLRSEYLNAIR